ncbi:unnamed protein product [Linum tenue]|uniref:4Fe-4S ferredoxin-type domain-containing protein n=1 Tax=Linum tenue TaxID=586396 RepID=A0AAV0LTG1_9ROSI|nr:unnamed protein product [Linum tenue]
MVVCHAAQEPNHRRDSSRRWFKTSTREDCRKLRYFPFFVTFSSVSATPHSPAQNPPTNFCNTSPFPFVSMKWGQQSNMASLTRNVNWDVVPPGCMNCTICPFACHRLNPPPPPPSPVLPYPSDVGPPPPPPLNCTTVPVQCCQYPTTTITPPVGYGYQPVDNYSAPLSPVRFTLVVVLLLSIVALL